MSLTSTNYTQQHLFTGRRNNGADYHLVYLITSIRDVRGYRSNVHSFQRASWSHHRFSLCVHRDHAEDITGFKGTAPEGNTEAAFQCGIAKSQSGRNSWRDSSGFLKPRTHFDFSRTCTATPSMQLQIGTDDRVAGQNTTNRLAKPEAYGVLSQTMGLSRPAELVLVRQF